MWILTRLSSTTNRNLKMKFLGYKVETIRPLNEARAVELGSSFLAEFFIFGVAGERERGWYDWISNPNDVGSLVAYEAIRSSQKSSDRNKQIDTDIAQLQSSRTSDSELLSGLTHKVELLEQENDALRGAATSLLSIVCLKEAQQRAWVPGFHQEALDNELLHIKRYLDTAKEAEGKRRMELGVIGEVESLNGTVTP
jgi:hypothetical protein